MPPGSLESPPVLLMGADLLPGKTTVKAGAQRHPVLASSARWKSGGLARPPRGPGGAWPAIRRARCSLPTGSAPVFNVPVTTFRELNPPPTPAVEVYDQYGAAASEPHRPP